MVTSRSSSPAPVQSPRPSHNSRRSLIGMGVMCMGMCLLVARRQLNGTDEEEDLSLSLEDKRALLAEMDEPESDLPQQNLAGARSLLELPAAEGAHRTASGASVRRDRAISGKVPKRTSEGTAKTGKPLCYPFRRPEIANTANVTGKWIQGPIPKHLQALPGGQPPRCLGKKALGRWACGNYKPPRHQHERLRYEVEGCDLLDFDGEAFAKSISGRTLLIFSDSIGQQHWLNVLCLLKKYRRGDTIIPGAPQSTCAKLMYGGKVCNFRIAALRDLQPGGTSWCNYDKKCPYGDFACCIRRMVELLKPGDLIEWSIGAHIKKYDEVKKYLSMALNELWGETHRERCQRPALLFRDISPHHFGTKSGAYDPSVQAKRQTEGCGFRSASTHNWQLEVLRTPRFSGIPQLVVYHHTANQPWGFDAMPGRRPDGKMDCAHWCMPGGVPDHWARMLHNYVVSEVWHQGPRGCK
eukprot:TRINITY_DN1427_c0_g1_i2.p1 TRINITY_DN1427_c0_g1~~TRINITY_DN1427_c0_g1_i2.p1  ORF type:complete len:504 (+),score=78.60 TRINITY_DN1427_c0_g1_i2:113-1513(+)